MGENIISVAQCPEILAGLAIFFFFFVQIIITSQVKKRKKDSMLVVLGERQILVGKGTYCILFWFLMSTHFSFQNSQLIEFSFLVWNELLKVKYIVFVVC